MKEKKENKAKKMLTGSSLKSTKQREVVLDVFASASKLLSAKDVFMKAKKASLDQVTVYRAIDVLEKNGFLRRVATGDREAKYELVDREEDHHHIICIKCKKIRTFTGCDAKGLIKKALEQVGEFASVSHHSFDIYGVCKKCEG